MKVEAFQQPSLSFEGGFVKKGETMRQSAPCLTRRSFVAAGACVGVASLGLLAGCTGGTTEASAPEGNTEDPTEQEANVATETNEGLAATGGDEVVYIVDRLTAKPGEGKALYDDFMTNMKPLMEGAGWTFVRATVAPAIWLAKDSSIIEIEWTMPDIAQAAWAYSSATRYNPEYVKWWAEVRGKAVSVDRVYSASESYMEVLNNV